MWKARLDASQAGIKIAGRNINNLRYADDITLTAENEEKLNNLFMRVKGESEIAGLKLFRKQRSWHPVPLHIEGEKVETVTDFIFLGSKITADGDSSHKIKRCLLLWRKAMTNLASVLKSWAIILPTNFHII